MARGDGGKRIFAGKEDHESFLHWLERVCQSHGWRVHAWVLMGNHFHLLLETPEPNLSAGMRVLLGTFSQAWNSRYQRRGHVFQGRYKAVPVAGERRITSKAWRTTVRAKRLHMGHPAAMSQLVNRLRKDSAGLKILKTYGKTFKSKD